VLGGGGGSVLGLGLSDLGCRQEVGEDGGLEEKEWERCENGFRREWRLRRGMGQWFVEMWVA